VKYLLDTDTCLFSLRRRQGVLERLLRESPDDIAVSAMTEAELTCGAIKSSQPEVARPKVAAFLDPLLVLPFDREAARHHAEIRFALRPAPIGERDLVTAAVAVANRLVLVTHNTREFARIDGLLVEDWASGAGD
jgi:tRNA(fMet)-specific endonuclease VapC